jgi:hypothetical protein
MRTKQYEEETVLYSRRVPKSKLSEIETLVENFLARFRVKKIPKKLRDAGTPVTIQEAWWSNGVFPEPQILVPREVVDTPAEKVSPQTLNKDSKTGVITYPCGCVDDGTIKENPGCHIGDRGDHIAEYWELL